MNTKKNNFIKHALSLTLILALLAFGEDGKIKWGGYGESHLNINLDKESTAETDFHRLVIFGSVQFNDQWEFLSEIEIEHNYVKDNQGELKLEQAKLIFTPVSDLFFSSGVMLVNAGGLNVHHEPPLFLSVERPAYHRIIIPTTWFGNGLEAGGYLSDFNWNFQILEGLLHSKLNKTEALRKARQNGFYSTLDFLLLNFSINREFENITAGFNLTRNQGLKKKDYDSYVNLVAAYAKVNKAGLLFTAEASFINYGNFEIENSYGGYAEIGYDLGVPLDSSLSIAPWVRYSLLHVDPKGTKITRIVQTGVRFKPIDKIALKIDYGRESSDNKTWNNTINAGFGFYF